MRAEAEDREASGWRPTAFVDLDSTLANTTHRWHLIDGTNRDDTDWKQYSLACAADEPVPGVVEVVKLLSHLGWRIVILSGRDSDALLLTKRWLIHHAIPYDDILLRDRPGHESWGRNPQWKVRRMREFLDLHPWLRPRLMIDDHPDVEVAMAKEGIPTLLVRAPGLTQVEGDSYGKNVSPPTIRVVPDAPMEAIKTRFLRVR